jgi:hypothetical protein
MGALEHAACQFGYEGIEPLHNPRSAGTGPLTYIPDAPFTP